LRTSSAGRWCSKATGSCSSALDAPPLVLPLDRLAPRGPARLSRMCRGRSSARVSTDLQRAPRPTRIYVRPGTGDRRRRAAATVARSRRENASRLAGARGGRVLPHLLLRLGDPLLSRPLAFRARRPNTDAARARTVFVLAGVGARVTPTETDRPRRRPRDLAAARSPGARRVCRQDLRLERCCDDPAPPPFRRQRLAQLTFEPRADCSRLEAHPAGALASLKTTARG
jgi:hypothetical protein